MSVTFVPERLPDQTLYSWVAMYHKLSGTAQESQTCEVLFGSTMAGRHFHIPSHLDYFCEQTRFAFGGVEEVIAEMTIIPFYVQFRSRQIVEAITNRVRGSNVSGLAQTLGFYKIGQHSWPPHKACAECVKADASKFGYSYWHLAHQRPCTLVCKTHGTMLVSGVDEHRKKRRLPFLSPEIADLHMEHALTSSVTSNDHEQLDRLAKIAHSIGTYKRPQGWDADKLRSLFLGRLQRMDVWHGSQLIDPHKLEATFQAHFRDLMEIVEFAPAIRERGIYTVWCISEGIKRVVHPEDWVIAIEWLFGSWQEFEEQYRAHGGRTLT